MAYVRKTQDRFRFAAAHLRRRGALLASGMKERELEALYLHDVRGLTFDAIAAQWGRSRSRVCYVFHSGYRKIFSPGRREIAFPKSPR